MSTNGPCTLQLRLGKNGSMSSWLVGISIFVAYAGPNPLTWMCPVLYWNLE
jgi:hypothetical protein